MNKKVVLFVGVGILVVAGVVCGALYLLMPHYYASADFGFSDEVSKVDFDKDGVEDYMDIVEGARAYVATKPEYEDKYYPNTGYPDDGKGVCTDVIWSALKAAGYDLRNMMAHDIAAAPEEYDIKTPNKNIDFRRVKNINKYLERHVVKLTTDLSDAGAFQYGDIVIFGENEHIGILSNKRNSKGLPLLIHHGATNGATEEDAIGKMTLTAHYRFRLDK